MTEDAELVRPATAAEAADPHAMHAANQAAWDEAAERYEGWFEEAVALIRSGGSNLFGVEHDLLGDLWAGAGTGRAIHLQCAGGRDTLSLWNAGAREVVGVDFSPRMLALARAAWIAGLMASVEDTAGSLPDRATGDAKPQCPQRSYRTPLSGSTPEPRISRS